MRWIDADALKEAVNAKKVVGRFNTIQLIDNAPTVEPTFGLFRSMFCETCQAYATNKAIAKLADEYTSPQGEWVDVVYTNKGWGVGMCNQCGSHRIIDNFCPNCGADMRKAVRNEEA